ncbi:hypothetical protein L226DRAFT_46752 [Lentinus tigrinus ALCF2SS1-7]|uniref:uncharacterized protein n=1 Tax=Lentinus tigrinus ALCF2SS1-7 TaxID=1328758 RepID=UPI001166134B|nr:hypothetical protein L226DRAFT_46752 [Lentinus tigrinus ALCF2SS1-7]
MSTEGHPTNAPCPCLCPCMCPCYWLVWDVRCTRRVGPFCEVLVSTSRVLPEGERHTYILDRHGVDLYLDEGSTVPAPPVRASLFSLRSSFRGDFGGPTRICLHHPRDLDADAPSKYPSCVLAGVKLLLRVEYSE